MPQAKPIISDDTVAALIGAMRCPNVTFTGSVDCSSRPPIARMATNGQPSKNGAATKNGTHDDERRDDDTPGHPSGPPARRRRSPPTLLETRKIAETAPAPARLIPRLVSITGTNVEKLSAVSVRSTTIRYSSVSGLA